MSWEDEYLTVNEVAEHLKLNPQTIRNWIDQGRLPGVRIGRRVRIRRIDVDRLLAEGVTIAPPSPTTTTGASAAAREKLALALHDAQALLGRRSAVRRAELAEGLQRLSEAVAAALAES